MVIYIMQNKACDENVEYSDDVNDYGHQIHVDVEEYIYNKSKQKIKLRWKNSEKKDDN